MVGPRWPGGAEPSPSAGHRRKSSTPQYRFIARYLSRWFLAIAALPSVAPPRLLLLLKLSHGSSPSHLVMKFEAESFRCHSPVLFRAYIPHFLCSLLVKILTLHRDVLYDMTYVRSSKLTAFLSRPGECFSRADPYNSIECFNGYGRPRL